MTRSALIAVCVLLTEFASQKRAEGMSITQIAMSAAKARLRPILMTSLTMIFGMLPLMFASGVGTNGNISIGVGTVGGMAVPPEPSRCRSRGQQRHNSLADSQEESGARQEAAPHEAW